MENKKPIFIYKGGKRFRFVGNLSDLEESPVWVEDGWKVQRLKE